MGANVFANGREISGKASDNKSIAAMPDVCLSPPPPPAGPVPIPYPNTSMASDSTDGTKTVTIGGKEVGMKNSSSYSKSNGDEPATQSFGANVGSHKLQGALHFSAWSGDVQFEGANAIRLGDMTTHNHMASDPPGVSALTASVAGPGIAIGTADCAELHEKNKLARDAMKSDPRKGVKGVGEGTTTITHAAFTPAAGPAMIIRACSRALVKSFDGGFVQGKNFGQKGGTTTVCGEPYTHPPSGCAKSSHTEPRILETIMGMTGGAGGGSLLLAINWANSKSPEDPCKDCNAMICLADCIDIKLCKDGAVEKPDCPPK